MISVRIRLDTTGLNRSLQMLRENTKHLPNYLVNEAGMYTAIRAAELMPRTDAARMDAELGVTTMPLTLKGNPTRAKKPKRVYIDWIGEPLAMRIVLASFYAGSRYNLTTGQHWRRDKPDTHGRPAFWQWVIDRAETMVKARHSAGGYFRLCAQAIYWMFKPATSYQASERAAVLTGVAAVAGSGSVSGRIGKIAGGTLATNTQGPAHARFWVSGTDPDAEGQHDNRSALYRIAKPVWDKALAEQAELTKERAVKAYLRAAKQSGFRTK